MIPCEYSAGAFGLTHTFPPHCRYSGLYVGLKDLGSEHKVEVHSHLQPLPCCPVWHSCILTLHVQLKALLWQPKIDFSQTSMRLQKLHKTGVRTTMQSGKNSSACRHLKIHEEL